MFQNLNKLQVLYFLPALILVQLWSLAGFTWPIFNLIGFLTIGALGLILTLRDLRLGIALLFLELLIGSKGYLFSLELGSFNLSIRIALWLIIMSVWLAQLFLKPGQIKSLFKEFTSPSLYYFLALLAACLVASLIGLTNNQFADLFFDANSWLFLLLAFPLASSFQSAKDLDLLIQTFWLGIISLSLNTLVLAFVFSHDLGSWPTLVYGWLRSSGLAEITWTPHGFWRVFLQSHLYLVPAFLALQLSSLGQKINSRSFWQASLSNGLIASGLFFSLSRSLWLGLFISLIIIFISTLTDKTKLLRYLAAGASSLIIAILIIWSLVASGSSSFAALLDRANIRTEAAASSRWNLLPILWQEIKFQPIFGQGFGATVFYHSADPRILSQDPSGGYRTYSFEWGWLDLWLKLGLWGMLIYLSWLIHSAINLFKLRSLAGSCLAYSLLALIIIHFFTPYLNHPLGLMLVLIANQALIIWQKPRFSFFG